MSAKYDIDRMTRIAETQNAELVLLCSEFKKRDDLLKMRKDYKRGNRVRLKGVAVYNTEKVLEIAREEESRKRPVGLKRLCGRPRKCPLEEIEEEKKDMKILSNHSDIELEKSVGRRTRSRIKG